jgi:hypothetical protein
MPNPSLGKNINLKNMWFHELNPKNEIQYQGRIIGKINDDYYLVQFHSFVNGEATDTKVVPFMKMLDWHFYHSDTEMRNAYTRSYKSA